MVNFGIIAETVGGFGVPHQISHLGLVTRSDVAQRRSDKLCTTFGRLSWYNTCTVSGKKWNHSIFASNFAKYWHIFNILSPTNRLSSKFLAKLLNIPPNLKRIATLPCEIVVFKNRNDQELCEKQLSCKTQPFKASAVKYLPSNV